MFKLLILATMLQVLAACAHSTPPSTGGYVPRDGEGRPIVAEIGKRYS